MARRTITVAELQRRLQSVIEDVAKAGAIYVLTYDNRPQAALVPYERYQHLQTLHQKEAGFELDRVLMRMRRQNANRTEGEVRKDIRLARSQVRRPGR